MSPQVMLFLLQAMFWAGFGDPARGRPPPCFSLPASPRALTRCMRRERYYSLSPRAHHEKVWLPASCPQNKSHKTPPLQQAWQCCCPLANALSLICACICDARRPSREQKVGWWARRHFTTRKRTHLGLIDAELISLYTLFV
jgi:hypothetical protein